MESAEAAGWGFEAEEGDFLPKRERGCVRRDSCQPQLREGPGGSNVSSSSSERKKSLYLASFQAVPGSPHLMSWPGLVTIPRGKVARTGQDCELQRGRKGLGLFLH